MFSENFARPNMLTRSKPTWNYLRLLQQLRQIFLIVANCAKIAAGSILAGGPSLIHPSACATQKNLSTSLYPATRNASYKVNREITPEKITTTYNNFYEFGSHKNIWRAAQGLQIRPWEVTIDGLVEKEIKVDIDTLLKKMQLEERIYRHRCVEAWAITVPWTGFPMRALLDYARPRAGAKYVVMEAFEDQEIAPGQRQFCSMAIPRGGNY